MSETENTETTPAARKPRGLNIDALRTAAKGLAEAEGDILTKHIDNYVVATEQRKIASKKLRQAVALLVPAVEVGEDE